jgi:hypothetical protein
MLLLTVRTDTFSVDSYTITEKIKGYFYIKGKRGKIFLGHPI